MCTLTGRNSNIAKTREFRTDGGAAARDIGNRPPRWHQPFLSQLAAFSASTSPSSAMLLQYQSTFGSLMDMCSSILGCSWTRVNQNKCNHNKYKKCFTVSAAVFIVFFCSLFCANLISVMHFLSVMHLQIVSVLGESEWVLLLLDTWSEKGNMRYDLRLCII